MKVFDIYPPGQTVCMLNFHSNCVPPAQSTVVNFLKSSPAPTDTEDSDSDFSCQHGGNEAYLHITTPPSLLTFPVEASVISPVWLIVCDIRWVSGLDDS